MANRKIRRSAIFSLFVSGVVIALIYLLHPVRLFHWRQITAGDEIIARVEDFRKNHGRLPETIEELGLRPDATVFYQKIGERDFCVWFGTTLGESETYSSRTGKWDSPSCF